MKIRQLVDWTFKWLFYKLLTNTFSKLISYLNKKQNKLRAFDFHIIFISCRLFFKYTIYQAFTKYFSCHFFDWMRLLKLENLSPEIYSYNAKILRLFRRYRLFLGQFFKKLRISLNNFLTFSANFAQKIYCWNLPCPEYLFLSTPTFFEIS